MEKKAILERIIQENGSCSWVKDQDTIASEANYICKLCPMSKLKKKDNGEWMNCVDALDVEQDCDVKLTDKRYLKKAEELLTDILIEELL